MGKSRTALAATLALALGAVASPALGDDTTRTIRALLSGYDEVPAVSTAGTGEFSARVTGDAIAYRLSYQNLRGSTTAAAHIHFGNAGTNGGVIVHLCGGSAPACPPVGGTVEGVITAAQIEGPAGQGIAPGEYVEVLAAIRAGVTYVNVHTDLHPSGEIRGQVK